MTKCLAYREVDQNEVLIEHGDPVDSVYFILRGKMSYLVKNSAIKDWEWAK